MIKIPDINITRKDIRSEFILSIENKSLSSDWIRNIIPESSAMAINEEISPVTAPCARKGRRMKLPVAPTSFIVWMMKRFAYTVSRTVLLISAYETIRSKIESPISMAEILLTFWFII